MNNPAGNLIADGAHSYTYDARGRMVQAMTGALTTDYRHNGLGQRVSKTAPGSSAVSHRFVYDESGHLIAEYDASGTAIQETVYLGDLAIAVLSGTNGIHYVHADQINTPRAITDTRGAVVWRWESDAFGVGAPDRDPDVDGLGFVYNSRMPGQYFDSETDLHYNYYRDYDPSLGRYAQSDPIGLRGGINTYAYVGNNPIANIDPTGLRALTDCEKGALSPYIPQVDLDNADLHDGEVPWYLPSDMAGITRGNDIYFRPGIYDASTRGGMGLLGHELVHVGQYRNGMTAASYLWSVRGGYSENSRYEGPAYDMQSRIRRDLAPYGGGACSCGP